MVIDGVKSRPSRATPILVLALLAGASGCGESRYSWAFAQNLDNSFHPSETCRESLAASIYASGGPGTTTREEGTNIFLYRGVTESYRIYAYRSQAECETALNGMVARQGR
jgi:hypothetical protein